MTEPFSNPFKPGAGHMPPYLAGRTKEQDDVKKALDQRTILENIILTGLRGVGKTVLLETFKPIAQAKKWLWIVQDMSETASITETNLTERIIADLSVLTSSLLVRTEKRMEMGFGRGDIEIHRPVGYPDLKKIYDDTPGLVSDKLKSVLTFVWNSIPHGAISGIVFAYDEAQNLADHAKREQYPLSLMLDVFQSIQRMGVPFILILTGLPTLFPKLVEARTYSERMFHVLFLDQLNESDSRDAILKPVQKGNSPIQFSEKSVNKIIETSGGYPYFIQFICKEVYDIWISQSDQGQNLDVPVHEITRKLDTDFFAGRWARATDRQRVLLEVIASLPNCDSEFSVQEVADKSRKLLEKPFSSSHINQMLSSLSDAGLVYKNRHGRYSFAVPLLSGFIRRQKEESVI